MKSTLPFSVARLAAALGYCCAITSLSGFADDQIEHITVSGSRLFLSADRLSASQTVLTEDEIHASGAIQITDLLRGLPGVSISQSGSPGALTEIRLRGSESNHLLVLIDGVIANDTGQGSLFDLSHLTTASIVRIELLRGPQSALWGSGGVGGILSITTMASQQEGASTSFRAGSGNRDTTSIAASVHSSAEKVNFRAYADYFNTAGDNVARIGNEADGYRNATAGLNAGYNITTRQQLQVRFRVTDYRNEYDGIDSLTTGLPGDTDNVTDGRQLSGLLRWEHNTSDSPYRTSVSWQYRRDENNNQQDGGQVNGTVGKRHQLTWLNQYQQKSWQAAAGIEYLQRFFEQYGPVVYGDPNQQQHDTTTSLFAELAVQPADNLFANISTRVDSNSEFDDAISYRAGITWQVTPFFAGFVSHGRAVKTPTFTERFGYFPGSFTGNPELTPENSSEWEIGLRGQLADTDYSLSLFDTRLRDEILGYVFVPALGAATAQNAVSVSQRSGMEATFDYSPGIIRLSGAYTYLDASQDDNGLQQAELRRARHQGSLTLDTDFGSDRFRFYTKLSYTGSREDMFYPPYPAGAERIGLRPYTLVSVALSYNIASHWQASLRVDNALDATYEDVVGYTGERRRILLNLQWRN